MKHIENKNDWFYEFRPILLFIFGLIGFFNRTLISTPNLMHISQFCGLVLVITAVRIHLWRQDYRKNAGRFY